MTSGAIVNKGITRRSFIAGVLILVGLPGGVSGKTKIRDKSVSEDGFLRVNGWVIPVKDLI